MNDLPISKTGTFFLELKVRKSVTISMPGTKYKSRSDGYGYDRIGASLVGCLSLIPVLPRVDIHPLSGLGAIIDAYAEVGVVVEPVRHEGLYAGFYVTLSTEVTE